MGIVSAGARRTGSAGVGELRIEEASAPERWVRLWMGEAGDEKRGG
jgi:hypothetical protein